MTLTAKSLALAAFLLTGAAPALAEDGPVLFGRLTGSWTGTGTITMNTGDKERIRCRVDYSVAGAGKKLEQIMRCASDSYKFDVKANVEYADGSIAGLWTATNYDITGDVTGQVDSTNIKARVRGSGLSVNLVVATTGDSQQISLVSEGTKVSGMNVKLVKGK